MTLSAKSLLGDDTRPFRTMLLYRPNQKSVIEKPIECQCIDVIRAFHKGTRLDGGRFRQDYRDARSRLEWLVVKFEILLPAIVLRPADTTHTSWDLEIMASDWSGPVREYDAYTRQHLWVDLYDLYHFLCARPRPLFQQTTLSVLKEDIHKRIASFLGADELRTLASVNRRMASICAPRLQQNAQIALWYNHAYLSPRSLHRLAREVDVPTTSFGQSVACMWAWLKQRFMAGTCSHTLSLCVVNRWSWASWVSSEAHWAARTREVAALSHCLEVGLSVMGSLRFLELSFVVLSRDVLSAIATHPSLRAVTLTGCGSSLHLSTERVPAMLGVRDLALAWDPLSAMECCTASVLLRRVPNVARLSVRNRARGSQPLIYPAGGIPGLFPRLEVFSATGADTSLVESVLRRCRSTRLRSFRVDLGLFAPAARMAEVINLLIRWSRTLETVVFEGYGEPDNSLLRFLGQRLPHIRRLALFPRLPNQSARTHLRWNMVSYEIAASLENLRGLQELCTNVACPVGTIGPACLVSHELGLPGGVDDGKDDAMDLARAAAVPMAARLASLEMVSFVGRSPHPVLRSYAVKRASAARFERVSLSAASMWWNA